MERKREKTTFPMAFDTIGTEFPIMNILMASNTAVFKIRFGLEKHLRDHWYFA